MGEERIQNQSEENSESSSALDWDAVKKEFPDRPNIIGVFMQNGQKGLHEDTFLDNRTNPNIEIELRAILNAKRHNPVEDPTKGDLADVLHSFCVDRLNSVLKRQGWGIRSKKNSDKFSYTYTLYRRSK